MLMYRVREMKRGRIATNDTVRRLKKQRLRVGSAEFKGSCDLINQRNQAQASELSRQDGTACFDQRHCGLLITKIERKC